MTLLVARVRRCALMLLAPAILWAIAPAASAAFVNFGQSQAYGISTTLDLTLLNSVVVHVGIPAQPVAQGLAPAPYNSDVSLASLSVVAGSYLAGLGTLVDLNTGLLHSTATSNVDGAAGIRTTDAAAVVNNLNLGIAESGLPLALSRLISITATTITTNSSVTGDVGSLVGTGGTTVENLVISVLGIGVYAHTGAIAPNTTIDVSSILGGVSIILNEQGLTGDGINDRSITTNAIHLRLTSVGVAGVGTLNGDLIIDHTFASEAAPEPSSFALLGIGGAALAGFGHRRSRQRRQATIA